ncbi:NAD(P) transhydrogenase subunit alpha [Streptomyces kaniharaensis]|uniref:proton-translocating NAD(P)(+) transhydrogenase n=1 Tax=Streptomyces kaniharaensis TaxID=212423 RepID=A0A6N7KH35_9ACTN|nr:NAD(P) transhydrogenase subunit alpha [Streptomyces kaniharaensis]MQS10750.1 NAD(P) transhydrogenase subunit alpha [Streptomyces kaniharaensis]
MTTTTVGVLRETAPGERRVALVPDLVPAVGRLGAKVLVEPGAGALAGHHDADYRAAGAALAGRAELLRRADVLLGVHPPAVDPAHDLHPGQVLAAMLRPHRIPYLVRQWADRGVTAIGLDLAPSVLPAGYPLDAEASQARVAGYRAVLLAAARLDRCLPPWGTADALFDPVRVLVVGAGHAGLQATDTARRLGAQVGAVELRRHERAAVAALGVGLLDLPGLHPVADDRELRRTLDHERSAWTAGLGEAAAHHDLVVTDLGLPGRMPPVLLTTAAVAAMRPGSVLVDLAAGPEGGNIEGVRPDTTMLVGDGVTVIGAGDLAAQVPGTASRAYAHNVVALLARLPHDGSLVADPVLGPMLVTHRGTVLHEPTGRLLLEATAAAGLP